MAESPPENLKQGTLLGLVKRVAPEASVALNPIPKSAALQALQAEAERFSSANVVEMWCSD